MPVRNLLSSWGGISVLLREQQAVMVLLQGLIKFPATLQEAVGGRDHEVGKQE